VILADKYIFVHVPKTGGQSISRALGGKTQDIATHTPLSAVDKDNRFAFGFVRNPWDRMVSLYCFLCQKTFKVTDNFNQKEVKKAGFKKWLMQYEFYMQEDCLREGLQPMQRRTQLFWLRNCDYVGMLERIENDFKIACKLASIKQETLPHVNKTERGVYQQYYDNKSREHVAKFFEPEITKFGYLF